MTTETVLQEPFTIVGKFNVAFAGYNAVPYNEKLIKETAPGLRLIKDGAEPIFINASKPVDARLRSGEMTYAQMLKLNVGKSTWTDDDNVEQTSYYFTIPQNAGIAVDELMKLVDKQAEFTIAPITMDYLLSLS